MTVYLGPLRLLSVGRLLFVGLSATFDIVWGLANAAGASIACEYYLGQFCAPKTTRRGPLVT